MAANIQPLACVEGEGTYSIPVEHGIMAVDHRVGSGVLGLMLAVGYEVVADVPAKPHGLLEDLAKDDPAF